MCLIYIAVAQNDVVIALVHATLCILAQFVDGLSQSFLSFGAGEEHGQLHGVESLVSDVAEYVQLCVVQDGMRQAHHLTVGFVGT